MAMHAAKADLPAQITLDQAIVALLTLRRRNVPGDAILDHATVLRFHYAMREEGTKEGTAERRGHRRGRGTHLSGFQPDNQSWRSWQCWQCWPRAARTLPAPRFTVLRRGYQWARKRREPGLHDGSVMRPARASKPDGYLLGS